MLVWFSLRSPGLAKKKKRKVTLTLLPQRVTLSLLTASGNNLLFSILRNQLKFPLSPNPLLCKTICIILDPWVMSLKAICLFLPLSSLWTEAMYHKELCGFPIPYQRQQMLEQCVHKGRSNNPPMYCSTCHLQVIHSTPAILSGQQSQCCALLCLENHTPSLLESKSFNYLILFLWHKREFACFNFELTA